MIKLYVKPSLACLVISLACASASVASAVPDYSAWAAFSENITNCTPGTFQLPNMVLLAMQGMLQPSGEMSNTPPSLTYKINGWQAGACQVIMVTPTLTEDGSKMNNVTLTCGFSQENLPILADNAAKIASGTISISTDDPVSLIMSNACK